VKTDLKPPVTESPRKISRRTFIATSAAAGAGALVIAVRHYAPLHLGKAAAPAPDNPFEAWIHINPDNSVQLVLAQSEMGQGVYTSLPMILAEEAEIDWQRVSVTQSLHSLGTGGSGSVMSNYLPLRQAGAVAREAMINAAVTRWGVPHEECIARLSQVIHQPSGRKISYGELVPYARRLPLPNIKNVKLKDPKDFTILGRPLPHLDIPGKCTGTTQFGLDVRIPGMVYAVIARCPTFGGVAAKFDATKALAIPGVLQVFEISPHGKRVYSAGGIVVVAKNTWAAMRGRDALNITWNRGPHATESSEGLRKATLAALAVPPEWSDSTTGPDPDTVDAAKRIDVTYEFPFLAHATMEPLNITLHLQGQKCEVWAGSQAADAMRTSVAKELGLPEANVTVHTTFMGGGFGRRYDYDFPTEGAQIARHVSSPVQLVWTREDDMTHDFYRPAGMYRMRAGLDQEGNIIAWSQHIASTSLAFMWDDPTKPQDSELPGECIYPVQHSRMHYSNVHTAVPRGWWRSVGNSFTGFCVESFVDELAHAAGQDPYQFRRRLLVSAHDTPPKPNERPLEHQRLINVLDIAAQKSSWGTPLGPNRGRGICCTAAYAYLAQVAEVTIKGHDIKVDRIVTVVDAGQVINPNGARSQLEGGTLFTLGSLLKEEITIRNGAVEQDNFSGYDPLRIQEAPTLETYIIDSHAQPCGLGEAAVSITGPSVANAIFAACGKRLRKAPLRLYE
jgi:isoquinoline 1-oxidoreductase subunit beta